MQADNKDKIEIQPLLIIIQKPSITKMKKQGWDNRKRTKNNLIECRRLMQG